IRSSARCFRYLPVTTNRIPRIRPRRRKKARPSDPRQNPNATAANQGKSTLAAIPAAAKPVRPKAAMDQRRAARGAARAAPARGAQPVPAAAAVTIQNHPAEWVKVAMAPDMVRWEVTVWAAMALEPAD